MQLQLVLLMLAGLPLQNKKYDFKESAHLSKISVTAYFL